MSKVIKRPRGGASIPCPRCNTPTRVLQTRRNPDTTVRRERNCPKCNFIFNTNEKPARVAA
jgi:transcriptional regulator NrdR family protein